MTGPQSCLLAERLTFFYLEGVTFFMCQFFLRVIEQIGF